MNEEPKICPSCHQPMKKGRKFWLCSRCRKSIPHEGYRKTHQK